MRKFTINGKDYPVQPFDFNLVADLEELGINMFNAKGATTTVRGYAAICMNVSLKKAGEEIGDHVINGGDITDIVTIMNEEQEKSDFFQALLKGAKTETQESAPIKESKTKVTKIKEV